MTKSNQSKTDQKIITQLQSEDADRVIKTITELRESGNSSYVPVLIELLQSSEDKAVNSKIMNLLFDIKHRDFIPQLLEAIKDDRYVEIRKDLVSVCWENGMDFSKHLPVFTDLLIHEKLEIAIEAYSVITDMTGKIEKEKLSAEIIKIKEAVISGVEEQKKQLLFDIIEFLPQLSE